MQIDSSKFQSQGCQNKTKADMEGLHKGLWKGSRKISRDEFLFVDWSPLVGKKNKNKIKTNKGFHTWNLLSAS